MRTPTPLIRRARSATTRLMVAALPFVATAVALAQESDNAPPTPGLRKVAPVWLGYLIMVVLLGAVIVVSLLPSKRGHQD